MPTNKNALLRYRILDRCFSDFNKEYEIDDLVEEVNERLWEITGGSVSLRQIREDIKNMRDSEMYNAPIEAYAYDGRKCYYRYSDPDFSIFKNELSDKELTELRSTIEMLGRYRGVPANAWLEEVISNLECRFGVKPTRENLVSFDSNGQLKGLEHLSTLIDATINHRTVKISYQPYKGEAKEYVLHPYFMKNYNGRWFLFGLREGKDRITNLALDRIAKVSSADIPFRENTDVDFNTYFNDIVGVTNPQERVSPEKIVLRFSPERFPYVISKPIHPSQREVGDCVVEICVKPNLELSQQIFSYIPDVEVVSPQWYREEICGKIEENLKKYFTVQEDCTEWSYICGVK